jgi:hypothetical protein
MAFIFSWISNLKAKWDEYECKTFDTKTLSFTTKAFNGNKIQIKVW